MYEVLAQLLFVVPGPEECMEGFLKEANCRGWAAGGPLPVIGKCVHILFERKDSE